MFVSSKGGTASIVTLDGELQLGPWVKLEGHTNRMNDILPLPSHQCVTSSDDSTIKVWDCQTGTCLRTLTQHTNWVKVLALHPDAHAFASGSCDCSVSVVLRDL